MTQPKIGLALGSGAARGWAHIGVIETLLEEGISPDIVCGTSMGALVGGVYASGKLDELTDWALKLDWRGVAAMLDVGLLSGGLIDGAAIIKWLTTLHGTINIEDLPRPYGAVATDLTTGHEIWMQSGPLEQAIRASIALPGVFSPLRNEGRWLVDGGLVNPVPVSLCRAMGAEFIIAVNVNENVLGRPLTRQPDITNPQEDADHPEDFLGMIKNIPNSLRTQAASMHLFNGGSDRPSYFDVLANSIDIMQDHITRSRLAGEPPHVLISPHLEQIRLMDFDKAKAAIDAGRVATQPLIPTIKSRLEKASA